jgi:cell fate (sporulation/competence/biofilm development) regulator YlbF (YheA/YmcA/DUF963 family)
MACPIELRKGITKEVKKIADLLDTFKDSNVQSYNQAIKLNDLVDDFVSNTFVPQMMDANSKRIDDILSSLKDNIKISNPSYIRLRKSINEIVKNQYYNIAVQHIGRFAFKVDRLDLSDDSSDDIGDIDTSTIIDLLDELNSSIELEKLNNVYDDSLRKIDRLFLSEITKVREDSENVADILKSWIKRRNNYKVYKTKKSEIFGGLNAATLKTYNIYRPLPNKGELISLLYPIENITNVIPNYGFLDSLYELSEGRDWIVIVNPENISEFDVDADVIDVVKNNLSSSNAFYYKGKIYLNSSRLERWSVNERNRIVLEELIHLVSAYLLYEEKNKGYIYDVVSEALLDGNFKSKYKVYESGDELLTYTVSNLYNNEIPEENIHELFSAYIIYKIENGKDKTFIDKILDTIYRFFIWLLGLPTSLKYKKNDDIINIINKAINASKSDKGVDGIDKMIKDLLKYIDKNNIPTRYNLKENNIILFNDDNKLEQRNVFDTITYIYNNLSFDGVEKSNNIYENLKKLGFNDYVPKNILYIDPEDLTTQTVNKGFIYAISEVISGVSEFYQDFLFVDLLIATYHNKMLDIGNYNSDPEFKDKFFSELINSNEIRTIKDFYSNYIPTIDDKINMTLNNIIEFVIRFKESKDDEIDDVSFQDLIDQAAEFTGIAPNIKKYKFKTIYAKYIKILDILGFDENSKLETFFTSIIDSIPSDHKNREILVASIQDLKNKMHIMFWGLEAMASRHTSSMVFEAYNKRENRSINNSLSLKFRNIKKRNIKRLYKNLESKTKIKDLFHIIYGTSVNYDNLTPTELDSFIDEIPNYYILDPNNKNIEGINHLVLLLRSESLNYIYNSVLSLDSYDTSIHADISNSQLLAIILKIIDDTVFRLNHGIPLTLGQLLFIQSIKDKVKFKEKDAINKILNFIDTDLDTNKKLYEDIILLHFIRPALLFNNKTNLHNAKSYYEFFLLNVYATINNLDVSSIDTKESLKELNNAIEAIKGNSKINILPGIEYERKKGLMNILRKELITHANEVLFNGLRSLDLFTSFKGTSISQQSDILPLFESLINDLGAVEKETSNIFNVYDVIDRLITKDDFNTVYISISKSFTELIDKIYIGDKARSKGVGGMIDFIEELYDAIHEANQKESNSNIYYIIKEYLFPIFDKYDIHYVVERTTKKAKKIKNASQLRNLLLFPEEKFPIRLVHINSFKSIIEYEKNKLELLLYLDKMYLLSSTIESFVSDIYINELENIHNKFLDKYGPNFMSVVYGIPANKLWTYKDSSEGNITPNNINEDYKNIFYDKTTNSLTHYGESLKRALVRINNNNENDIDIIKIINSDFFTPTFVITVLMLDLYIFSYAGDEISYNEKKELLAPIIALFITDESRKKSGISELLNNEDAFALIEDNDKYNLSIPLAEYNEMIHNLYRSMILYQDSTLFKSLSKRLYNSLLSDSLKPIVSTGKRISIYKDKHIIKPKGQSYIHTKTYPTSYVFMQKLNSFFDMKNDSSSISNIAIRSFARTGYFKQMSSIYKTYNNIQRLKDTDANLSEQYSILNDNFKELKNSFVDSIKTLSGFTTRTFRSYINQDNSSDYIQTTNAEILMKAFDNQPISINLGEGINTFIEHNNNLSKTLDNLSEKIDQILDEDYKNWIQGLYNELKEYYDEFEQLVVYNTNTNSLISNRLFRALYLLKMIAEISDDIQYKVDANNLYESLSREDKKSINNFKRTLNKTKRIVDNMFFTILSEIRGGENNSGALGSKTLNNVKIIYSINNDYVISEIKNIDSVYKYLSEAGINNYINLIIFYITTIYGAPSLGSKFFHNFYNTLKKSNLVLFDLHIAPYMFKLNGSTIDIIETILSDRLNLNDILIRNLNLTLKDADRLYFLKRSIIETFQDADDILLLFHFLNKSKNLDNVDNIIKFIYQDKLKEKIQDIVKFHVDVYNNAQTSIAANRINENIVVSKIVDEILKVISEDIKNSRKIDEYIKTIFKKVELKLVKEGSYLHKTTGIRYLVRTRKFGYSSRIYNTNTTYHYTEFSSEHMNKDHTTNIAPSVNKVNSLLFSTYARGFDYIKSTKKTYVFDFYKIPTMYGANYFRGSVNKDLIDGLYLTESIEQFYSQLRDPDSTVYKYILSEFAYDNLSQTNVLQKKSTIIGNTTSEAITLLKTALLNNFDNINKDRVRYLSNKLLNIEDIQANLTNIILLSLSTNITSSTLKMIIGFDEDLFYYLNSISLFSAYILSDIDNKDSISSIKEKIKNNLKSIEREINSNNIDSNQFYEVLTILLNGATSIDEVIKKIDDSSSDRYVKTLYNYWAYIVSTKDVIDRLGILDIDEGADLIDILDNYIEFIIYFTDTLYANNEFKKAQDAEEDGLIYLSNFQPYIREIYNKNRYYILQRLMHLFNYRLIEILNSDSTYIKEVLGESIEQRIKTLLGFTGLYGHRIHYFSRGKDINENDKVKILMQLISDSNYAKHNITLFPDIPTVNSINNRDYSFVSFSGLSDITDILRIKDAGTMRSIMERLQELNEGDPDDEYYEEIELKALNRYSIASLKRNSIINKYVYSTTKSLSNVFSEGRIERSFGPTYSVMRLLYGSEFAEKLSSKVILAFKKLLVVMSITMLMVLYANLSSLPLNVIGNFLGNVIIIPVVSIALVLVKDIFFTLKFGINKHNKYKIFDLVKNLILTVIHSILISASSMAILLTLLMYIILGFVFNLATTALIFIIDMAIENKTKYKSPLKRLHYAINDRGIKTLFSFFGKISVLGDKNMHEFIERTLFDLSLDVPYKKTNMFILSKTNAERMISYFSYVMSLRVIPLKSLNGLKFTDVFKFSSNYKLEFNKNFIERIKKIKNRVEQGKKVSDYEYVLLEVYNNYRDPRGSMNDVDMSLAFKPIEEAKKYAGYMGLVNLSQTSTPAIQNLPLFDIFKSFRFYQLVFIEPLVNSMINLLSITSIVYDYFGSKLVEKYSSVESKASEKITNKILSSQLKSFLGQFTLNSSLFALQVILTNFIVRKYNEHILFKSLEDLMSLTSNTLDKTASEIIYEISEKVSDFNKLTNLCDTSHKQEERNMHIDHISKKYNLSMTDKYSGSDCYTAKNKLAELIVKDVFELNRVFNSDEYKQLKLLYYTLYSRNLEKDLEPYMNAFDFTNKRTYDEILSHMDNFTRILKRIDRMANIYRFYSLGAFDNEIVNSIVDSETSIDINRWEEWSAVDKTTFLLLAMSYIDEYEEDRKNVITYIHGREDEGKYFSMVDDNEFYKFMKVVTLSNGRGGTLKDMNGNEIPYSTPFATLRQNCFESLKLIKEIYNDRRNQVRLLLNSVGLATYENIDIVPQFAENVLEEIHDDKTIKVFQERNPDANTILSLTFPPTIKKAANIFLNISERLYKEEYTPFIEQENFSIFKPNVTNMTDDIAVVLDYLYWNDRSASPIVNQYVTLKLKTIQADILFLNKYSVSYTYKPVEKLDKFYR